MRRDCEYCRHGDVPVEDEPCASCAWLSPDSPGSWEPVEPPAPGPSSPPASGCPAGVVVPWGDAGPCYVGFPEARPGGGGGRGPSYPVATGGPGRPCPACGTGGGGEGVPDAELFAPSPEPPPPPEIAARVAELEAAYAAQSRAPATHGPAAPPGVKLDGAKTRWDLLPWPALELVAQAFTQGASKYSDYGWKTLPDARRRYFAAAIRHAVAWVKGERLDPESGLPHLAHLACNALFLLSFELGETGGPAALEEPKPPAREP